MSENKIYLLTSSLESNLLDQIDDIIVNVSIIFIFMGYGEAIFIKDCIYYLSYFRLQKKIV